MTPQEYCQEKAARSGSSFYYSFLFLPEKKRQAITALYAFCREVDDIVDSNSEPHIKNTKLSWWRDEIDRLFNHDAQHPITLALTSVIGDFNLPREYFLEVLDGMEMDLYPRTYDTFKELRLYCYRVASVVGLMSAEIFGYTDRQTLKYAHDLGLAFQLTNIIRDVLADLTQDRIYLPQEDLVRFGVTEADMRKRMCTPEFKSLMSFQIQRAHDHYQRAFAQLPEIDRHTQRTGLVMAEIYQTLLAKIEKDSCQILAQRVTVAPIRKLWVAWRTNRRETKRHHRQLKHRAHA